MGDEGGQGVKEDDEAPRDIEDSGGDDNVPPTRSPIVIDAQHLLATGPCYILVPHTLGRAPAGLCGLRPQTTSPLPLFQTVAFRPTSRASPRAVPLHHSSLQLTWSPPAHPAALGRAASHSRKPSRPQSRPIPLEELWTTVFSMPLSLIHVHLPLDRNHQLPQSIGHLAGAP